MNFIDTETGERLTIAMVREDYREFAHGNADEAWTVGRHGFDSAFHWHLVDAVFRFGTLEIGGDAA